jgi:hypothetical protein
MNLDVFRQSGGAFSMRSLTAAINNAPFVPGRIGQLGIFNARGISTTTAMVEQRDQKLYLVPNTSRGGPAKKNQAELRQMIPLKTAHLPVEDRLMADEIQDVRAFGSDNQLEGIIQKVNEKMATMARSLDATLEYHRVGAINGLVLDADGATPILNIYDAFGVSQQTEVDFDLDNASPEEDAVRKKCALVIRKIEDELGATPYAGVHCLCSDTFFDDLVGHPEVKKAYDRWMEGQALRDRTARRSIFYAGIMFEEYRGKVGAQSFIPTGKARFFPTGVADLFDEVYAPANWIETANTIGLPRYAKQTIDHKGRWVDIDAQANPLVYCTRPRTLIPGKRT